MNKLLFSVTVQKPDGSWATKTVLIQPDGHTSPVALALARVEAAFGVGCETRNVQTLGTVDIDATVA